MRYITVPNSTVRRTPFMHSTQPSIPIVLSRLWPSTPKPRFPTPFPRSARRWRESKDPRRTQSVFLRRTASVHRLNAATPIVRPRLNLPTTRSTPPHGSECISMAAEELEKFGGPARQGGRCGNNRNVLNEGELVQKSADKEDVSKRRG